MKPAPGQLIFESACRGNILPLTSGCNVRCVFCSHYQNPSETEVYSILPQTPSQVEETLQFVNPHEKIVIGESVTKIIEGEPFTNPEIFKILTLIRSKFPRTPIHITTNGTYIDRETVRFLRDVSQVEITLSLNSLDAEVRRTLMNDPGAEAAVRAAFLLAEAGVSFHGSLVAMPHITGWGDLERTVHDLDRLGATTVRVFLPGFTRLAPTELRFEQDLWHKLSTFIDSLSLAGGTPVTLEPPLITDLGPAVRGVIKGSAAYLAGIRKGDMILTVNGESCFSRVDAFRKAADCGEASLQIERKGRLLHLNIEKNNGQKSGLVMDYDIDPAMIAAINTIADRYQQVKILCSELGQPVLRLAMGKMEKSKRLQIIPVKSRYFGGSIKAAGLLVVSDFLEALREVDMVLDRKSDVVSEKPEVILLPSVAFDSAGRDLTGVSFVEIQKHTASKVQII